MDVESLRGSGRVGLEERRQVEGFGGRELDVRQVVAHRKSPVLRKRAATRLALAPTAAVAITKRVA
jgi:hypothetical protein